jgi:hypothetical protein
MDGERLTDRERGRKALDVTRSAYADGCILIIHYECGMLGEGEAVPVHAIAVKDPVANETKTFLARDGEPEALASFAEFAESHRDRYWLHWNMRNAAYGFEHIQERLGQVCRGKGFHIPDHKADLGLICWQVYGDMPHGEGGKLHGLCVANDVTTAGALAGSDIQAKVKAGQWAGVKHSVLRKVEMIQALWGRVLQGTLRPIQNESGQSGQSPPSGEERCAPMSKTEIARRLLSRPHARPRDVQEMLERYHCRKEGPGKFTIAIKEMDAITRDRLLAPMEKTSRRQKKAR